MAGLSPAITNLVIVLGMMQVSKQIPFDDPNVLTIVRATYVVSNLFIAALYFFWVKASIDKKKDLTTIKYLEPSPVLSTEEAKLVTTTVHAYDLQQLRANYKTQLMGIGMMAFMHGYLKYTNPLLIQSILPVKAAFESNLVRIHVFGQPATGDLKRPFKAPAGFMGQMMGGQEIASDKKSVEAVEKAGRGGAKEE